MEHNRPRTHVGPMSEVGRFQTSSRIPARSVSPSTTDMSRLHWHVGFVPLGGIEKLRQLLLLIHFDVIPIRQLLDELEGIEWQFGYIHSRFSGGFGFGASVLNTCERKRTGLSGVRVFFHPQLVAGPHDAEHRLAGNIGSILAFVSRGSVKRS